MIYLTSDTHFGDSGIMKYIDRPFRNVEEMDRVLIENINNTVNGEDVLYILGDFTMGGGFKKYTHYLNQINCRHIRLILGNHDRRFIVNGIQSPFDLKQDYCEFDYNEIEYNSIWFCLSHYPMLFWNGEDCGSIMCHGHIHSSKRNNDINRWHHIKRFDVGVDANNYKPISIEYIWDFFEEG